jgi:hypothetical protein
VSGVDRARAVADAVLYEGYLLYPYRSTSPKNQVRWQFGVLGPPAVSSRAVAEEPALRMQCLLEPDPRRGTHRPATVRVYLRFLQLQRRAVERAVEGTEAGRFVPVADLRVAGRTWLSWDEAVEQEREFGPFETTCGCTYLEPVEVAGEVDEELLLDESGVQGRVLRHRRSLSAVLTLGIEPAGDPHGRGLRLSVDVRNVTAGSFTTRDAATAASLLGAHLILVADGAAFVSVIDPPDWARAAAAACRQQRCWPVLAGADGDTDLVLGSPIILYDYPALAPESSGALFDSTEIDEILTLRVITMTDEEKAAARATDPRAAAIVDRCEQLSAPEWQRLHGVLRVPEGDPAVGPDRPWWDPAADASVQPSTDAVLVQGIEVRRGSLVRLRPVRRADAQDLFYAGQPARVTAVLSDVDGETHVAVVLLDDPAADLHEWYGRYLYFAPDELEPLDPSALFATGSAETKESRP